MKKYVAWMLSVLLSVMLFVSCGQSAGTAVETESGDTGTKEAVTIRLGGLKGPTTMGLVGLLDRNEQGSTENHYEFQLAGSADELTPLFLKGELDIIAVPANLGSVLYHNADGAVQMLAVNTLGVVDIVEKGGETVGSMEDLRGKTIYATGKGSTPEYALAYLLSAHGMTLGEDVTVIWKSEPTEVVALMATEDTALAMLPQPYVTVAGTQLENLRIALDLSAEWDALNSDSMFITAGFFVRREFAEAHPDAIAAFIEEYTESASYVNENPAEASVLIEKYDIVKAAVAEKAIPYCNIVSITGDAMKTAVTGYFGVLLAQNPKSVGGAIPEDDFYYTFNTIEN